MMIVVGVLKGVRPGLLDSPGAAPLSAPGFSSAGGPREDGAPGGSAGQ